MTSKIKQNIHETVKDMYEAGLVDGTTMREFDKLCLEPAEPLSKTAIKRLRLREQVSQPVFAKYLNVSSSAVKSWECGDKKPSGAALRLLHVVHEHGLKILV